MIMVIVVMMVVMMTMVVMAVTQRFSNFYLPVMDNGSVRTKANN